MPPRRRQQRTAFPDAGGRAVAPQVAQRLSLEAVATIIAWVWVVAACVLGAGCTTLTHDRTALIAPDPTRTARDARDTWPRGEVSRIQQVVRATAEEHRLLEREHASNLSVGGALRWSIAAYSYHESLTRPGNVILLATGQRDRSGPIRIRLEHNYLDFLPPESAEQARICGPIWMDLVERLRGSFGERITEK
jgi:hypothetical protein